MKQQTEENSLGCGTELCCLHSCTELFAGSFEQQNRTASCGTAQAVVQRVRTARTALGTLYWGLQGSLELQTGTLVQL